MFKKGGLIYRFFSSNGYVLALLFITPILLYFVYGTAFYGGLDDIGVSDMESHDLEGYHGSFHHIEGEIMEDWVLERVNPEDGQERLSDFHDYTFERSFFRGMFFLASISFLVGSVLASVSWGTMAEDGSIVYPILLKPSRTSAFIEIFTLPLSFILFISFLTSVLISLETLNPFPGEGFATVFALSFLTIFTTTMGGYTVGTLISLLARNSFVPIIGSLLFIGGLNLFPEHYNLLYPARGFIYNHYYNFPVNDETYYGIVLIIATLSLSYFVFKRGDFY